MDQENQLQTPLRPQQQQSVSASYQDQWLLNDGVTKNTASTSRARGLSDPGKDKKIIVGQESTLPSSKSFKRVSASGINNTGGGGAGQRARTLSEGGKDRRQPQDVSATSPPKSSNKRLTHSASNSSSGGGKDKRQPQDVSATSPPKASNKRLTHGASNSSSGGGASTGRKSQKEMTKAERRAQQEKERAEKAARGGGKRPQQQQGSFETSADVTSPTPERSVTNTQGMSGGSNIPSGSAKQQKKVKDVTSNKQVALFSHLATPKGANTANAPKEIHPAVLVVGLQFAEYKICGANARCIATLTAFKKVIQDYKTPHGTTLSRHLQNLLSAQINYLVNARPMSVSMGNAIRRLKLDVSAIDIELSEDEAKSLLCEKIDEFIRDRITVSGNMIAEYGLQKIQDGDVILTYAKSSVVQKLLLQAHAKGRKFRVIIIDSRPRLEGKNLLRNLVDAGINCTYGFLHALGFALKNVSKVFLGAHALMSNGALYSRVGTAMVAMMARDKNIPVIVCCETYKFTDQVQLDSFVMNEQGNPNELVDLSTTANPKPGPLSSWLQQPDLKLLNLMYDLTPSQYITTVITEIGLIPCTSVPVILREFRPILQ